MAVAAAATRLNRVAKILGGITALLAGDIPQVSEAAGGGKPDKRSVVLSTAAFKKLRVTQPRNALGILDLASLARQQNGLGLPAWRPGAVTPRPWVISRGSFDRPGPVISLGPGEVYVQQRWTPLRWHKSADRLFLRTLVPLSPAELASGKFFLTPSQLALQSQAYARYEHDRSQLAGYLLGDGHSGMHSAGNANHPKLQRPELTFAGEHRDRRALEKIQEILGSGGTIWENASAVAHGKGYVELRFGDKATMLYAGQLAGPYLPPSAKRNNLNAAFREISGRNLPSPLADALLLGTAAKPAPLYGALWDTDGTLSVYFTFAGKGLRLDKFIFAFSAKEKQVAELFQRCFGGGLHKTKTAAKKGGPQFESYC